MLHMIFNLLTIVLSFMIKLRWLHEENPAMLKDNNYLLILAFVAWDYAQILLMSDFSWVAKTRRIILTL